MAASLVEFPVRPMPQPIRAIFGVMRMLMKSGIMPDPATQARPPHAERLLKKLPKFMTGKVDASILASDHQVPGRGGNIPVRVYTRHDVQDGSPAILFIHGGAFIDGGLDFTDNVQRGLAARTGFVVVGVSYRLAPEHPFPAGLEDCQDVLQWMVDTQPQGLDPTRLEVGGESAGGNLAAALVIANRDGAKHNILHQTIVYPFTDTSLTSTDWDADAVPGLNRAAGEFMVENYAGATKDNPLVSVLHADLVGLPPAMVISCGHDPLRTDGVRYAQALGAAGVETRHLHYDNMPHGYLVASGIIREALPSLDAIAADITAHLKA